MLKPEKMYFEPNVQAFQTEVTAMFELFKVSAIGVESLLPDERFHFVTKPKLKNCLSDTPITEGVDLQSVLEDDIALKTTIESSMFWLHRAFQASDSYAKTLAHFQAMLKENSTFDLASLETGNHPPDFYRDALQRYKKMYESCNSIIPAVDIGFVTIDCSVAKNELLPSPARCLTALQTALPRLAARRNHAVMKRIDDAVFRLNSTPTTTVEFVKLLSFLDTVELLVNEFEEEVKFVSEMYEIMEQNAIAASPEELAENQSLKTAAVRIRDTVKVALEEQPKKVTMFCNELDKDISALGAEVLEIRVKTQAEFLLKGDTEVDQALAFINELNSKMNELQERAAGFKAYQKQFKIEVTKFTALEETHAELRVRKTLWDAAKDWRALTERTGSAFFLKLDCDELTNQAS